MTIQDTSPGGQRTYLQIDLYENSKANDSFRGLPSVLGGNLALEPSKIIFLI